LSIEIKCESWNNKAIIKGAWTNDEMGQGEDDITESSFRVGAAGGLLKLMAQLGYDCLLVGRRGQVPPFVGIGLVVI
jgi:hypothetical protein